jgi:hypothetical protein
MRRREVKMNEDETNWGYFIVALAYIIVPVVIFILHFVWVNFIK